MGLFRHKQPAPESPVVIQPEPTEVPAQVPAVDDQNQEHFFDEYFREELRNRGRWYFEKILNENAKLFKQDLDATIATLSQELKDHAEKRLNDEVTAYAASLKAAQEKALSSLEESASKLAGEQHELTESLNKSVQEQQASLVNILQDVQTKAQQSLEGSLRSLNEQQTHLAESLKKNITSQEALLINALEDNRQRISAMQDAQDTATQALNRTVQAMQDQQQQLATALEQAVTIQKETLIKTFENNMAQVIEHYLTEAMGDQYELKDQLPGIVQQLEANKQTIVDDMRL